ncbi:MAG: hypothetical protein ACJAYU_003117 [Bradymonadia bacterium]|jgi:hypothetical protein
MYTDVLDPGWSLERVLRKGGAFWQAVTAGARGV